MRVSAGSFCTIDPLLSFHPSHSNVKKDTAIRLDIEALRADIPLLERYIPLANCSQTPMTRRTAEAAETFLDSWNRNGMDWDAWLGEVERARTAFARLIGAEPDEIAVTTSVSAATSAVASAIDFSEDRGRVVVSEAEFPGPAHAWTAHGSRGADIQWVPVRGEQPHAEDFIEAIDDRTAVVSATHAWYRNGSLQDIAQIVHHARNAGALTYVDAYQSAGVVPIDVKALDVDFLASGVLKYLMGLPGIAFLYVRGELADSLSPSLTGWFGRRQPFEFEPGELNWADGARRFDLGTPPILPAYVARAGLEWILDIGVDVIRERTLELAGRTTERLQTHDLSLHGPEDPAERTPITAVKCGQMDAAEVESRMRDRGYLVSARGTVVRIAPHVFNTTDEIDAAVEALADILQSG